MDRWEAIEPTHCWQNFKARKAAGEYFAANRPHKGWSSSGKLRIEEVGQAVPAE
jgi:hypothetical protein